MRLHIKPALPCTVHTCYIRYTTLLVQLCVYTSKPHFLAQCIQATYAVHPCWCNYVFTHQSRTYLHSAYRLHTLYLLACVITRLYTKAALPCTDIQATYAVPPCWCNYEFTHQSHTSLHRHTGYIHCTSLLVQLYVYTSKPHFLTQCIRATYAVPSCWCNYAFTHQSRTFSHSACRLFTYTELTC